MRYTEISGKVFSRKSDFVNSIVRACAPRVIEEEMFGVDNLRRISAKATLEASRLAEFLILQKGMTAYGKAYYRNQSDLVPNLAAKLEALRDEYPAEKPVDEYGALIYTGRRGIHGVTLPGRVTFSPGNAGFSTFGAPRPIPNESMIKVGS
ncbi:hypothetical protein L3X38_003733 [Prunus dulcis]|uniref:Uncharacterized protein n=1 Tax=Prunus dulcis TaxID=3755 RepID=A0AAD4ZML3_PRUDU|nr:hypothetical protein L3X38_003733 [Prunus dulcis]